MSVSLFSSVGEREDWFHTLSRALADHAAGLCTFGGPCSEVRKVKQTEKLSLTKVFCNPQLLPCHIHNIQEHVLIKSHNFHLVWYAVCPQAREKLWMALGEAAPVLVPVSHVMMCMNCTSDFSLTLRRHHCNACGKVRLQKLL